MTEKTDCSKHKWIPLLGVDKKRGMNIPTSLFTCLRCGDLRVGKKTIKISRFRLDMGELPINNVAGIKLIETPTTDKTASGLIVSMTYATESITLGDFLYFKSDGTVARADANGTSTYPVMGLALATTALGGSNSVLLHGVYKDSTYALTAGGIVYLSTNVADNITQTQPAVTNDVIQVVGIAIGTNRIYFNPSADYLTHT